MFAGCGIGAILIGQGNAIFLPAPGILARRLDAKLAFRPVGMLERMSAPFRWPLPVVDVVFRPITRSESLFLNSF
jgi:hypothetical protein